MNLETLQRKRTDAGPSGESMHPPMESRSRAGWDQRLHAHRRCKSACGEVHGECEIIETINQQHWPPRTVRCFLLRGPTFGAPEAPLRPSRTLGRERARRPMLLLEGSESDHA